MLRRQISLWVFLSLLGTLAAQSAKPVPTIIFTANINAALDDCGCSDSTVGGLNRLKTVVDSLYQLYPHAVVIDGGDMLTSYSQPALNQTVVNLLWLIPYHAIAVGDQELVEGWAFFQQAATRLPLRIHNLLQLPEQSLSNLLKPLQVGNIAIAIITSPRSFEFIDAGKLRCIPVEAVAQQPLPPVVILHGDLAEARLLASATVAPRVILVGHSQEFGIFHEGKTTLVAVGSEGEHVALVQLQEKPPSQVRVTFVPVGRQVNPDPQINARIEQFYQSLQEH